MYWNRKPEKYVRLKIFFLVGETGLLPPSRILCGEIMSSTSPLSPYSLVRRSLPKIAGESGAKIAIRSSPLYTTDVGRGVPPLDADSESLDAVSTLSPCRRPDLEWGYSSTCCTMFVISFRFTLISSEWDRLLPTTTAANSLIWDSWLLRMATNSVLLEHYKYKKITTNKRTQGTNMWRIQWFVRRYGDKIHTHPFTPHPPRKMRSHHTPSQHIPPHPAITEKCAPTHTQPTPSYSFFSLQLLLRWVLQWIYGLRVNLFL